VAGGAVARVLVDSPLPQLDQLFDYAVPERLRKSVLPGVRVRVPLRTGGRIAAGWLVELADTSGYGGALSELEDVVSEVPLLVPRSGRCARAVADRAAGNASDVLRLAIPSRHVRVDDRGAPGRRDAGSFPSRPPAIHGAAAEAHRGGHRSGRADVAHRRSASAAPPVGGVGRCVGRDAGAGRRARTRADRSALLVVPDYRDQEQLEAALGACVDARRCCAPMRDSRAATAFRAFLDATRDEARVIVGNRSTIYAPC
jgi:primosomal protein N' (replication factor Y)